MKATPLWKTLTRTQRRAWSAWAKSNKVLLDDGSLRFVSGRKAMTMVVRNRTLAGEATNPSVVPAPFAWQMGALSLRDAGPFTENTGFVGFRAEQNLAGGTRFFVLATPPVDGGAVNPHAQLRFVTCLTSDGTVVNDLMPITAEYQAVNGSWDGPGVEGAWPVDTFIWLRVHQYANGQLGPGVMLKGRIIVEL
jgi:hypothetical protein